MMNRIWITYTLLFLHIILLIPAFTNFTIITCLTDSSSCSFCFYKYAYKNGWGYQYQSDYSLSEVLTYSAAYFTGIIAFAITRRGVRNIWNTIGSVLCILGFISFSIEGTHWLWAHHLSLIAISPAASLILAILMIVYIYKITADAHTESSELRIIKNSY